jgi:hypothetical protein
MFYYPLANEVAKGYNNASVRRGNPWHTEEPRIVTMLYKIRNNLVDIAPEQCLTGGDYRTRRNTNTKL